MASLPTMNIFSFLISSPVMRCSLLSEPDFPKQFLSLSSDIHQVSGSYAFVPLYTSSVENTVTAEKDNSSFF